MYFYGLVGEKLSHSLSPKINTMIFDALNIDAGYKLFEIPNTKIGELGEALKLLDIKGVNVTIPYKQEVMKQLDYISDEARNIGAVNTILNKDGKLYGYNSDYFGFKKTLEVNNINVIGKDVVVLGNGGAAKAINQVFIDMEVANIYLVTRNKDNAGKLNSKIKLIDYDELKSISGDVLVNATPVGMYPKIGISPVGENIINKFDNIIDIVYNPKMTEFLKIGQKLNKKIYGGLYMLVGQAIKSEEIWQNTNIDKSVLNDIYKKLENEFE